MLASELAKMAKPIHARQMRERRAARRAEEKKSRERYVREILPEVKFFLKCNDEKLEETAKKGERMAVLSFWTDSYKCTVEDIVEAYRKRGFKVQRDCMFSGSRGSQYIIRLEW